MRYTMHEAAEIWQSNHTGAVEFWRSLRQNGVPSDVFSSSRAEIGAIALDIDIPPSGDVDLLIRNNDFDRAASLLGGEVVLDKAVRVTTGDGRVMTFRADEAVGRVGDDEIQFMRPRTPVHVGSGVYDTRYTDAAIAAGRFYGSLSFADTDTTLIYALGQRQGDKHDATRAAVVFATEGDFRLSRAHEIGVVPDDLRVQAFLSRSRAMAATLLNSDLVRAA